MLLSMFKSYCNIYVYMYVCIMYACITQNYFGKNGSISTYNSQVTIHHCDK